MSASDLTEILKLPLIDFNKFFNKDVNSEEYQAECKKVADAFHEYGVVIVRDPRAAEQDNNTFLDMVESYFEISDGVRDARPQYSYQVGVTPADTEVPRDHTSVITAIADDQKPLSSIIPKADPKWRFFWRIGPQPETTNFPSLNPEPVVPPEFPQWKDTMDMWGGKLLNATEVLAEMAAVGFDLPSETFSSRMKCGPHLLAPTASNFNKYGALGTVLAGFHSDLNFMTIHGKSRYPGLRLWTREGKRVSVAVPDGCLLVQAGKQFEYLTGGYVLAGYHEVIVNESTVETINRRREEGKSMWRISSTLFSHIQSDQVLQPLPPFDSESAKEKYPPKFTGDFVAEELSVIALSKK